MGRGAEGGATEYALLTRALELDRRLLRRHPELARSVTLLAKTERELGNTFRV